MDQFRKCNGRLASSLRVAVIVSVIIVIFFAVTFVFFFVFFLIWFLSKEDIGSRRVVRRIRVGTFWMYFGHSQSYASNSVTERQWAEH